MFDQLELGARHGVVVESIDLSYNLSSLSQRSQNGLHGVCVVALDLVEVGEQD